MHIVIEILQIQSYKMFSKTCKNATDMQALNCSYQSANSGNDRKCSMCIDKGMTGFELPQEHGSSSTLLTKHMGPQQE